MDSQQRVENGRCQVLPCNSNICRQHQCVAQDEEETSSTVASVTRILRTQDRVDRNHQSSSSASASRGHQLLPIQE